MKKVLFVCLGNICRSPTAEAVFKGILEKESLTDRIQVDSCGTGNHHEGERADPRMQEHAIKRGFNLTSIARGIRKKDFEEFDHIITMDHSNFNNVIALAGDDHSHKVKKMTDFSQNHRYDQVPDPYYGGPEGFELVLDLLEDACDGLLKSIKEELNK